MSGLPIAGSSLRRGRGPRRSTQDAGGARELAPRTTALNSSGSPEPRMGPDLARSGPALARSRAPPPPPRRRNATSASLPHHDPVAHRHHHRQPRRSPAPHADAPPRRANPLPRAHASTAVLPAPLSGGWGRRHRGEASGSGGGRLERRDSGGGVGFPRVARKGATRGTGTVCGAGLM